MMNDEWKSPGPPITVYKNFLCNNIWPTPSHQQIYLKSYIATRFNAIKPSTEHTHDSTVRSSADQKESLFWRKLTQHTSYNRWKYSCFVQPVAHYWLPPNSKEAVQLEVDLLDPVYVSWSWHSTLHSKSHSSGKQIRRHAKTACTCAHKVLSTLGSKLRYALKVYKTASHDIFVSIIFSTTEWIFLRQLQYFQQEATVILLLLYTDPLFNTF